MQITSGKIKKAIKVVLYGEEGVGKSTFASQFPNPLFIDTEQSTTHMDVRRLPAPQSWDELRNEVLWAIENPDEMGTLVLDTADWAEQMCSVHVCKKAGKKGIEDFGYGKGHTYLGEEFSTLLVDLNRLIDLGVNVVVNAHAKMRKFEQPDESGAYDRWELKLGKQTAPLLKEWADLLLFAQFETVVVKTSDGKAKATQGRNRIMHTTHHACWDAKNRFGLPEKLPLDYGTIAHIIPADLRGAAPVPPAAPVQPSAPVQQEDVPDTDVGEYDGIPHDLKRLMLTDGIKPNEVMYAVAQNGTYTPDTPIANYDPEYIRQVLIGAWESVKSRIISNRMDTPF